MSLIDTHAHLAHKKLSGQVQAVLQRAREAGVTGVICAAGDLHEAQDALALARQHEDVYGTVGVHPHEAKDAPEGYLRRIEEFLDESGCVALGEIGLDYHYDFSPRDVQCRVFAEQLALGVRRGATIVVHTREAFDDTLALLRESGADGRGVVFHSFTGGENEARRALDFGATLSFSGIATFPKADDVRRAALLAPAERILVETDAPYLSPEPVRNRKVNEPANVVHVARRLAELRGQDIEAFAQRTSDNARRIFHLDNRPCGRI